MKYYKNLIVAGALVFGLTGNVWAGEPSSSIQESDRGPLETYVLCVGNCVDRTPQWSFERSVCAADCYILLLANMVKVFIP
jgi:hypothetical protein